MLQVQDREVETHLEDSARPARGTMWKRRQQATEQEKNSKGSGRLAGIEHQEGSFSLKMLGVPEWKESLKHLWGSAGSFGTCEAEVQQHRLLLGKPEPKVQMILA